MQIYKKSIRPELISICNSEIDELLPCRVWSINQSTWNEQLLGSDFPGVCISAAPSNLTKIKVKTELAEILPEADNITMNYNVFFKNSGIRWHSDADYKWGATLYLNDWNIKWGGLFLWEDKQKDLHAICPNPGTLIINTEAEQHFVTHISPTAEYPRRSLQIWGTML